MSEPGRFLPYGRQLIDDADVAAVTEVLASDFLTTGPEVARFEAALCEVTGARHAVAVSSGTAALHCAYFAAGLGPGDEIVTSPLTFAATANAALYLGAEVRFADVAEDSGNLDPAAAEGAITPRTRMIVAIDYAGHPADYEALAEVASRRGLTLVADAAHSLGGSYHGRPVGTLAPLSTTSFHPVKPVTTSEGGAVLTDDEAAAARARRFRNHGIEPASDGAPESWKYAMQDLGFNYRLPDLLCALGRSQLGKLDRFLARRRALAERYSEELADLDELLLPEERSGVRSGWHLYVVRVSAGAEARRALYLRLREMGLGVQVHYLPVYLHPYYRRLGFRPGLCPVAERRASTSLSLPLYPALTDADVDSVVDRVRRAVRGLG